MPGLLPHLIAGSILYLIGRLSFRSFFRDNKKLKKNLLLFGTCLLFSILPDFFLGLYYLAHLEPETILMQYQIFTHLVLTPFAIFIVLLLTVFDTKRRPLWLMGASALILHLVMDFFIKESSYLWFIEFSQMNSIHILSIFSRILR
jgi:hypothetical protein